MYLIAGLGNPGKEYEATRHNAGFRAVDALAAKRGVSFTKIKNRALYAECFINGEKCVIIKPVTYMNASGESVAAFARFYGAENGKIIVAFDDTALPAGDIRVRKEGGAGGHNGVKDIILRLNTDVFTRVRIGIGAKPPGYVLADYVLSRFTKEENEIINGAAERAALAIECIITENADAAMNKFNTRISTTDDKL